MDEAFHPLHRVIVGLAPTQAELRDDDAGVRSYIHRFEIDSPLELDVSRDDEGVVRIGTTPPLYYVSTSYRPSYHRMRFRAELQTDGDGD